MKVDWTAYDRLGVTSQCRYRSTFPSHSPPLRGPRALQLRHLDSSQVRLQHSLTMAKFDGAHEKRGSHDGLYAARVYRHDRRRLLRGLRESRGRSPFVPAAASAASPAPADEPGLTAVRREPGFPPKPKSGGLMTACTQPGCTGMIVDSYCEVCGSPAGADPFVPAAASAASPAPADEPGLTAVRRGPGFPPKPKSGGLMTACTQPGCTGMIVDSYCEVCGSPAGAARSFRQRLRRRHPLLPTSLA